jgi:hypothetical protein
MKKKKRNQKKRQSNGKVQIYGTICEACEIRKCYEEYLVVVWFDESS